MQMKCSTRNTQFCIVIRDELQMLGNLLTLNPTGFRIHLMCVNQLRMCLIQSESEFELSVMRFWFHEAVFTQIHSFDTKLLM